MQTSDDQRPLRGVARSLDDLFGRMQGGDAPTAAGAAVVPAPPAPVAEPVVARTAAPPAPEAPPGPTMAPRRSEPPPPEIEPVDAVEGAMLDADAPVEEISS